MNRTRRAFLALIALLAFTASAATFAQDAGKNPAVVYIIRHGEKPPDKENSDLTEVGFRRAAAIPSLFLQQSPRLPRPEVLFATARSKHSNRPVETITPLSTALHLPIHNDYEDADFAALAREVLSGRYAGKVVLICWHHGEIPHLTAALGVPNTPKKWDDKVFDQIWKIEWHQGQAQLTPIPQQLLPGDTHF